MIRLVALACGLLCGAGIVLSGLHDPALLHSFLMPQASWGYSLGLGLLVAIVAASLVVIITGHRNTALLGGEVDPLQRAKGWKPLLSAVFFGLGWGLTGYIPLTAMVAAGMFSPGAAIFLGSVLGGMIVFDLLNGDIGRTNGRPDSRG